MYINFINDRKDLGFMCVKIKNKIIKKSEITSHSSSKKF